MNITGHAWLTGGGGRVLERQHLASDNNRKNKGQKKESSSGEKEVLYQTN
jgi:hypothetical protein